MDTALDRAPDDAQARFAQILNSAEQEQHTNQTRPLERAVSRTTMPAGDVSDPPS
jgi:hypothetical protein